MFEQVINWTKKTMIEKILVIGGTGMLGKPVAIQLKKDNFNVSVLTRNKTDARIKMPAGFEIVEGDVNNFDSLVRAMNGIQGVYINLAGGSTYKDIDRTERQGTINIVNAAKESGVQKIAMITGASIREENTWYAPTKSKYLAEQAVIQSGIPYIIFRPTWFMETLPLMVKNGKAIVPGKDNKSYPWLAASDYAELVSKSMMTSVADNRILTVTGPKKYSIAEALNNYVDCLEPKPEISKVPIFILKALALITLNKELRRAASLFSYFEKVNEDNKTEETDKLLGTPKTTLVEWINERKT